jgi:hypothetical protein
MAAGRSGARGQLAFQASPLALDQQREHDHDHDVADAFSRARRPEDRGEHDDDDPETGHRYAQLAASGVHGPSA